MVYTTKFHFAIRFKVLGIGTPDIINRAFRTNNPEIVVYLFNSFLHYGRLAKYIVKQPSITRLKRNWAKLCALAQGNVTPQHVIFFNYFIDNM